ncbi:alpha-tocopherol transfer protein isoform X2 [Papilio machaon]|uniref:alpha-tocopherol transfer protein isoform X2 n=1 Tax=Papilio machaon TaxID=76193 RepID=UPI001E663439|nr:alpha-tocopherol transfer protein isoform X2 [Papilio machaon]
MDVVLKKYNVTHKQLQEIVDLIHDWYEKQPHLPKIKLDDRVIVRLLVSTKFRIEKVKDKIDALISTKHKTPEFLFNRDPLSPIIDEYLRYGFFAVLPKKTPDNHRISIFRIKSPREFVVIEVIKIALMTLEYRRYNDVCLGDQYVYDLSNVRFSNSVQMTPPIVTKMVYYVLYCSGSKIKGIHLINMPAFAIPILGLIKKLLKPKIAARIHIHSKPEDIANVFPKSILPKEYGGDELSFEEIAEEWRKTVQSDVWRQYFIDQDKVISDESKRTRVLSCNEVFGCDGSFRKLEFD